MIDNSFTRVVASLKNELDYSRMRATALATLRKFPPESLNFANTIGGSQSSVIWQLWLQGEVDAPKVVKTCFASVDKWCPDSNVTRLSETNLSNYTDIPGYIHDKYRAGIIIPAHFSDVVRANLLANAGGTWIDATVFLSGQIETFTRSQFFAFQAAPPSIGGSNYISTSSWFIHSTLQSRTMKLINGSLEEYWRTHNSSPYYGIHFLLTHFKKSDNQCKDELSNCLWRDNITPHFLQFAMDGKFDSQKLAEILSLTPIHKLTHYGSSTGPGNNSERQIWLSKLIEETARPL